MDPSTVPLLSQVGGHSGVLTTEDGLLLIKPSSSLELQFYRSLLSDDVLEPLRPFVPTFYGTLKLEGRLDPQQTNQELPIAIIPVDAPGTKDEPPYQPDLIRPTQSLVLENLSHRFLKPNILDIKLGTVLYDESASPEKVARMIQSAQRSTSLETGIRLTGFQIHDNVSGEPVRIPKQYGRSIKPSDLPEGIALFFPLASSTPTIIPTAASYQTSTPSTSTHDVGLPRHTLLPILHAIREDIAEIRDAISQVHMRMVGGSILIVYEADWARAEEGVELLGKDEDSGEEDEDDDDDDEDEDEEDDETIRPAVPYAVKLIDFAHTRLKPGQGPDEGVLLGLDTVLKLLDGRIEHVCGTAVDGLGVNHVSS